MEGMTEIPEKMTAVEFEELYSRAVIRLKAREGRYAIIKNAAADEVLDAGDESNGQKKN